MIVDPCRVVLDMREPPIAPGGSMTAPLGGRDLGGSLRPAVDQLTLQVT